eukprot:10764182-Lingulodinium_polyedra.AAC.1
MDCAGRQKTQRVTILYVLAKQYKVGSSCCVRPRLLDYSDPLYLRTRNTRQTFTRNALSVRRGACLTLRLPKTGPAEMETTQD